MDSTPNEIVPELQKGSMANRSLLDACGSSTASRSGLLLAWWTWGLRTAMGEEESRGTTEKNDPFLPSTRQKNLFPTYYSSFPSKFQKMLRENKLEGPFLKMSQGRYSEGPMSPTPGPQVLSWTSLQVSENIVFHSGRANWNLPSLGPLIASQPSEKTDWYCSLGSTSLEDKNWNHKKCLELILWGWGKCKTRK